MINPSKQSYRIVVVDDHPDAAEILCVLLRLLGHEAIAAVDGESGMQAVEEHDPQIVILDIGLPDRSGYDVARELRERYDGYMYLIAITGWGEAKDRARSLDAGFDRHIVKPPTTAVLKQVLGDASAALAKHPS